MKYAKIAIFFSLALLTLAANDGNAVPGWFAGALERCKQSIPGALEYNTSKCGGGFEDWCADKTPHHKLTITDDRKIGRIDWDEGIENPGLGKCCTFDDNGTIVDKQLVQNGNDECTALMNKNPQAKHSGIWWIISEGRNHRMDWWYRGK